VNANTNHFSLFLKFGFPRLQRGKPNFKKGSGSFCASNPGQRWSVASPWLFSQRPYKGSVGSPRSHSSPTQKLWHSRRSRTQTCNEDQHNFRPTFDGKATNQWTDPRLTKICPVATNECHPVRFFPPGSGTRQSAALDLIGGRKTPLERRSLVTKLRFCF